MPGLPDSVDERPDSPSPAAAAQPAPHRRQRPPPTALTNLIGPFLAPETKVSSQPPIPYNIHQTRNLRHAAASLEKSGALMDYLPKSPCELRRSQWSEERVVQRSVRQVLRKNLLCKKEKGETLFHGVHGYEDTVLPQIVNAILSRHHFILLGLRGQAKSRILRGLVEFMDDRIPYIAGCEIHDNPYNPLCRACRDRIAADGDATPIAWLAREHRYVEKLAPPDVTIADMIGDIDPIKAARAGKNLSDELTIHYGLLPRANRGIFGINELPDLAGKIQVGLFNIMQEGDIQIKGYPVRLALDVLMVFTANPEDYTARGKIVTPLKDRIGSEIRTHYPATVEEGVSITAQEAWVSRENSHGRDGSRQHI